MSQLQDGIYEGPTAMPGQGNAKGGNREWNARRHLCRCRACCRSTPIGFQPLGLRLSAQEKSAMQMGREAQIATHSPSIRDGANFCRYPVPDPAAESAQAFAGQRTKSALFEIFPAESCQNLRGTLQISAVALSDARGPDSQGFPVEQGVEE